MAGAEAICEAVTRPTMRFVEIKTRHQQSVLMVHRTRHLFVRQRTTLINALRAHLAEFGIVAGIGRNGLERLLNAISHKRTFRRPVRGTLNWDVCAALGETGPGGLGCRPKRT